MTDRNTHPSDTSGATDPGEAQEKKSAERGTEDISFWTIVLSTLSAAIGVQSRANKERDFRSGRVAPFIVAGLIFTVAFVATLVAVVGWVLPD